MDDCAHDRLAPEVCDQTLGVACLDCNAVLWACWMDRHVPESAWNRACENGALVDMADVKPRDENRDDVCAICGKPIRPSVDRHGSG